MFMRVASPTPGILISSEESPLFITRSRALFCVEESEEADFFMAAIVFVFAAVTPFVLEVFFLEACVEAFGVELLLPVLAGAAVSVLDLGLLTPLLFEPVVSFLGEAFTLVVVFLAVLVVVLFGLVEFGLVELVVFLVRLFLAVVLEVFVLSSLFFLLLAEGVSLASVIEELSTSMMERSDRALFITFYRVLGAVLESRSISPLCRKGWERGICRP